ncbi:MAG: nucleotidyltransferase family protein [Desulfomonile sp.]|nr:nucleotidyltransferase family protein [Desulfomonile sp.]
MQPRALPFTAMILVGGLGLRLRTMVSDRPKPMALVGGKPFLEILIDCLAAKGVRDFVLLSGYMSEKIEEHFTRAQLKTGLRVRCCREETPLGTGGAVRNAARFATEPTLVVNGDTFFDANLGDLLRCHNEHGSDVTLSLRRVSDRSRYGSVVVNEDGRVTGFVEKGRGPHEPGLINAGVSVMARSFILSLPRGVPFSMEQDVFPSLAATGRMSGLVQESAFFDIGTPESYQAFLSYAREHGLAGPGEISA